MSSLPARRVRVAYFVPPSAHFAGIERVVHEIATGMMLGHGSDLDVHVLYCTDYKDSLLDNTLYKKHVLGVDRLRGLIRALRRKVAEEKYDVFICPQVEPSVIAWTATRGLGMPIFLTHLHGNPRIEESMGSRRTRISFQLFRHVISRRISGILAVSPTLRDYAAGAVSKHTGVHYAKNPARDLGDIPDPSSAGEPEPGSRPQFNFVNVARLAPQKGLDVLLRAIALARPEIPDAAFTLVGNGPDEQDLKRLSAELGIDDIVHFAGYTADPGPYFQAADCFVLSSRWEGFPLVLLEALRFGLPILATNCDFGPADLITDPRIGELVDEGDEVGLAAGMARAMHRQPSSEDDAFRRNVAYSYRQEEAAEMHLSILREIILEGSARSRRGIELAGLVR